MKGIIASSLVCLGILSGCAQTQVTAPPVIVDSAIRSEVDQLIAQSGAEAASSLREIAAIQRVRTPAPSPAIADNDLPADLRVKATFEWNGPAKALVKELAGRVGYQFRESGSAPAIASMVNISLRETSVGQALADVGLQVQRVATIIVDPSVKVVEYRNEAAAAPVTMIRPLAPDNHVVRHTAHRAQSVNLSK